MAVLIRTFSSGIHTHPVSVHTASELNCQTVVVSEFGAQLPLEGCTPTIILNNPIYIKLQHKQFRIKRKRKTVDKL